MKSMIITSSPLILRKLFISAYSPITRIGNDRDRSYHLSLTA